MKSDNITVTDARVHRALDKKINQVIDKRELPQLIEKKINDSKIKIGTVIKFYQFKDEALVKLSNNKQVKCKILHRCIGSLIDYFTPEGDDAYCEEEHERCIIPMYRLDCLVAEIKDDDYLLLGYYYKDDITLHSPASKGYYNIKGLGATNEYGINIGQGKVEINTYDGVEFVEGVTSKNNTNVKYADNKITPSYDDIYVRDELYTKEEVDELIREAIDELKEELGIDNNSTD